MNEEEVSLFCEGAIEFFEDRLNYIAYAPTLRNLLKGEEPFTIIDVRTKERYDQAHVKKAINIPYDEHNAFYGEEGHFPELRKDAFNYVYCYDHYCKLASRACRLFNILGYPSREVLGGWKVYNNKHQRKPKDFPIDITASVDLR